MPNERGDAYALTALCPIEDDSHQERSFATEIRERLKALELDAKSPMAKVPNTFLCRIFVLDEVLYQDSPAIYERLQNKYLVFVCELHGKLDPYLIGMWENADKDDPANMGTLRRLRGRERRCVLRSIRETVSGKNHVLLQWVHRRAAGRAAQSPLLEAGARQVRLGPSRRESRGYAASVRRVRPARPAVESGGADVEAGSLRARRGRHRHAWPHRVSAGQARSVRSGVATDRRSGRSS